MNVPQATTLVAMAAPILTEATCVAVLEASSGLGRGEGTCVRDTIQEWTMFRVLEILCDP